MPLSDKTVKTIKQFSKQQAQYYLDEAELTYLEKMRNKTSSSINKIENQLNKFKQSSDTSKDAQNDLAMYMTDFIVDLMQQGYSEEDALAKAEVELSANSSSTPSNYLNDRFLSYYSNKDPQTSEQIGLVYGSLIMLGMLLGALAGFILGGGMSQFLNLGWIYTILGFFVGLFIGLCAAMLINAIILNKRD